MQQSVPFSRIVRNNHYYHPPTPTFTNYTSCSSYPQTFHKLHRHIPPAALHEMLGSVGSNPSASTSEPPDVVSPAISPAVSSPAHQPPYGFADRPSSAGEHMQLCDLLLETAQFISQCDWNRARPLLEALSRRVSSTGDSTERVASCFFEALATRFSKVSGTAIIELLPAPTREPCSEEVLSAYLALNQVTPFMRFAHLTANQALLEALTGEDFVHIVDLDIGHGVQWSPFLQALADLRGQEGYTIQHLRITGVGRDREMLERTGARLLDFAQSIHLPFEYANVIAPPESLAPAMLDLRAGEAVAVNCMLQLHRLLAKGPEKLTSFLTMLVSAIAPKVVTLAELEASHNQPHFLDRFAAALKHYSTLFDSLEATLPPTSAERTRVEQTWYKTEIANIVACDGAERTVRHQRFEEWRQFFARSGFQLMATSRFAVSQARLLLRLHYPSDGYQLVEGDEGGLLLGWQEHPLFCVSAWQTSSM